MRIVFMGTPFFAAACLEKLSQSEFDIVGVYTKPDVPRKRGMKLTESEVKQVALEKGYPIYQPASFRDEAVCDELAALKPDLIAVVAYGKILPQRVLDIPRYGCINMHGSILPQLRGAAPVQWAVLNGLEQTGVTAMYLSAGMDEGDIIEIRKTPVLETDSSADLMQRLSGVAAELLVDTVRKIADGTATRTPQDSSKATYAPMLTKEMSPIDWSRTARQIVCQIHGLDPWPAATAELCGTRFKIYNAVASPEKTGKPWGTPVALTKQGLLVACGDGGVILTELQVSGGKRMAAVDYFRGHPISL